MHTVPRADETDVSTDSRWWYWIVLTPLYAGTLLLFGLGFGAALVLGESTTVSVFIPAFLILGVLALLFGVTFPVALYKDTAALANTDHDWEPNDVLYASAGVVGVLAGFLGTIPLGAYYLYRRHCAVGVP